MREGYTGRTIIFEGTRSCHTCVLDKNSKTVGENSVRTSGMVRFIYYPRKSRLTRCVNCGRNPTARCQKMNRGDLVTRKRRTEEHPSLIKSRGISILRRGQNAFGVGAVLLTRRKTKKTGLVNVGKARRHAGSPHVFLPVQAYLICTTVNGLLN